MNLPTENMAASNAVKTRIPMGVSSSLEHAPICIQAGLVYGRRE